MYTSSSPSYYNPSSSWRDSISPMFSGGSNSSGMMNQQQGGGSQIWDSIRNGLPGIAGGIASLINGNSSGAGSMQDQINNAMSHFNQNTNQANQYLQPYQEGGINAYNQYSDWLNRMQNPTGFYNDVMSQYQMSPAAQFQLQQGTQAANRSAAAGGNVGTPAAQKALMQYSQGLSAQDMQNYFNNVQGINQQYGGALNNLNQMGFNAANQMGQNLNINSEAIAQLLQNLGLSQAYGQQQQGAGMAGGIGGIISGIGGLAGLF